MQEKEIKKRVSRIERKLQQVLEQKRLAWLRRICQEARDIYGFAGLGELVMWMIDHAGDIRLKSGDVEVTGCESLLATET